MGRDAGASGIWADRHPCTGQRGEMNMRERGEILLQCLEEEVGERLNPSGEDCPECGGDGYTYHCFEEWACFDPEGGCSECARRCLWCAELNRDRLKAVRE